MYECNEKSIVGDCVYVKLGNPFRTELSVKHVEALVQDKNY